MRQKSTVYSREEHNQFQKSEEQVKMEKAKKAEVWKKEEKEGQSPWRVKKETKRD